MIITAPTGFFDVVPPSEAGNVTFTISAGLGERKPLSFLRVPVGVGAYRRTLRITQTERRNAVSAAAFSSVMFNAATSASSGAMQFEPGQIINFTPMPTNITATALPVSDLSVRHDSNLLDYVALGLSAVEVSAIEASSLSAYSNYMARLSDLQQQQIALAVQLDANSKQQNEAAKVIAGLEQLIALDQNDQTLIAALAKLKNKLLMLQNDMTASLNEAAAVTTLINQTRDDILALAQLVK